MTSELETNIVSVERTKEYSETPTEVHIRLSVCSSIFLIDSTIMCESLRLLLCTN